MSFLFPMHVLSAPSITSTAAVLWPCPASRAWVSTRQTPIRPMASPELTKHAVRRLGSHLTIIYLSMHASIAVITRLTQRLSFT